MQHAPKRGGPTRMEPPEAVRFLRDAVERRRPTPVRSMYGNAVFRPIAQIHSLSQAARRPDFPFTYQHELFQLRECRDCDRMTRATPRCSKLQSKQMLTRSLATPVRLID